MGLLEIGGKRLPFLRWSFVRMFLGMPNLGRTWQIGDGREDAVLKAVLEKARKGDVADAIRVIDDFGYNESILINVGDEKGEILDAAVRRANAKRILELGTYIGYSGLRMARVMAPGARLHSVDVAAANAAIARRIWDHAGVSDRVTCVVGSLGDGGETIARLEAEHGFGKGMLDLVFIDHAKQAYLPDLERIVARGWLHPGSIVVADNVKFPGAPEYRAAMKAAEGKTWRTVEHEAHLEYQTLVTDLVLESEYLGPQSTL